MEKRKVLERILSRIMTFTLGTGIMIKCMVWALTYTITVTILKDICILDSSVRESLMVSVNWFCFKTKMTKRALLFSKDSGKTDKKMAMASTFMVLIFLCIMKGIGRMIWKRVKGGYFLKTVSILVTGTMTKNMGREN